MPMSRYDSRSVKRNANRLYEYAFKERDVQFIRHFTTAIMDTPTTEQIERLEILEHTWSLGDRFYKLAFEHYGDPEFWWVIAWFNKLPTESHLELGDSLMIPFPLERLLNYYGR